MDDGGPPTVLQGPYIPLSTSTPIRMQQGNQQMMDSPQDKYPYQQVLLSVLHQSLYPTIAALGTSVNTVVSPSIPFSRRVINNIEEQQRIALEDTVEGTIRSTNTSPISIHNNRKMKFLPQPKSTSWYNTSRYPSGNYELESQK